jgi:peptidoglycan-associated lipoprotein
MNARFLRLAGLSFVLSATLILGACGHKKSAAVLPSQTPPPPAKPTVTLTVSPSILQQGQSAQLTWSSQNATNVTIDPIGVVSPSGTQSLIPSESITYTLTAKGPGGSIQANARVTVTAPPPVAVEAAPSDLAVFQRNAKDIYFDYDRFDVRTADATVLKADASFLSAHPNYKIVISGYCDERGSEDYNMALGSSRADGVRDQLQKLGIGRERIKTISYGKEKPFCTEQNEQCRQQNRRAHFSVDQ